MTIDEHIRVLLDAAGRELVEADTDDAFVRADSRLALLEMLSERCGVEIEAEARR